MGRPDRTLRWVQIASQWQTRPAAYEHVMGDSFTELGLDEEAEAAYKRVADLQPDMPESWMGLCRLRLLQGDTRAARDIWLANQAHYEAFDFARQMGAQVEFFTRHYSEAKTIYKTLVETAPDGGAEFFGAMSYKSALGRLLQLTGENEQAAELLTARLNSLRQRLEPAPRDPNILYELAAVESSLDLSGPALEHLQAAVGYGWLDHRSTVIDPRFDNIRFHVQFREAIEAMRQKVALLREGVNRK
jgi:tetratricopeptide (TPR) repeat protein